MFASTYTQNGNTYDTNETETNFDFIIILFFEWKYYYLFTVVIFS